VSNVPHNHHFVPQFLLRNFLSDEGKLWVYDTETKTIEDCGIKGAAAVRDLYARNSPGPDRGPRGTLATEPRPAIQAGGAKRP